MKSIKAILMRRDGLTAIEVDKLIEEAREQLYIYLDDGDYLSAGNVCEEFFGLEPDHLMELI